MSAAKSVLWQKNPILAWREIDGQIVIVSPNDSMLHELNETGSFVWKQLDGNRPAFEIAASLAAEYDVKPEEALSDIEALLEEFTSRQLLLPSGDPATGRTA